MIIELALIALLNSEPPTSPAPDERGSGRLVTVPNYKLSQSVVKSGLCLL